MIFSIGWTTALFSPSTIGKTSEFSVKVKYRPGGVPPYIGYIGICGAKG